MSVGRSAIAIASGAALGAASVSVVAAGATALGATALAAAAAPVLVPVAVVSGVAGFIRSWLD